MRIVHLVEAFSVLSETFIYDSITQLQADNTDNCIVTFNHLNVAERPFSNVIELQLPSRWHPARLRAKLQAKPNVELLDGPYADIYRQRLKKILAQVQPDIIHAHLSPMGCLAAPVAKALGIPLFVAFHGYDAFQLPQKESWQQKYRFLFQQMAMATVVSKYMRDHLISLGAPPEKVSIIHVGKKMDEFAYRPPERKVKHWSSIGRVVEKKGFDDCIKAFASATEGTDATLKIIGDGEQYTELKAKVAEQGLSERVFLLGALPHSETKRIIRESDAFILCSKTAKNGDKEGIPTVLMEAQALGLPCVTTRHSGIPEVLPSECQKLLADEGDVTQIAESIKAVAGFSVEQLKEITLAGRVLVERDFNLATETHKLINLYQKQATASLV
jgi:colanic acid/amylovoran biosynthesis glycosyltransferase